MRPRHHRLIRFLAGVVTVSSLTYVAQRAGSRVDVTSERLSALTDETIALIEGVSAERPVVVHAFVSKEVPGEFVPVQSSLLRLLREMDVRGGEGLSVRIVEPLPYSEEAQEAVEKYGITPRTVLDKEGNRTELFLGMAFVSGPREEVVPFLDRGLSAEYEVARALRMVSQEKKKVVGILRTDAPIMGNFDLQARRQQPAWRIVEELRKQYEVRSLNPATAVPDDVDVLLVPQLASCTQPELDQVKAYVDAGRPALITVDPMPLFDLRLSPSEPKLPPPGQQGGMFGQPPQGGAPKGDYAGLLRHLGVEWPDKRVLFDTFKPHPSFADVPPQVVFVGSRPDGTDPFTDADPVVDGLTEVVVLFGGELKPVGGHESEFTPLLVTGQKAGANQFDDMVQRHMLFGLQGPVPPRQRAPITGERHVIGARIKAEGAATAEAPEDGEGEGEQSAGPKPRNLIVLADLDLFGDQFFAMHERGGDIDGDGLDDIRFDNVTFLLNAVDSLAGDDRFVELRKRQPRYRRLETVDKQTLAARDKRERQLQEANQEAQRQLDEAQQALEQAVAAIRDKQGLDETTKAIMIQSAEDAENRRLQAKQERIEREKQRAIARTEMEHRREVDAVRNGIRLFAVLLPPIPALVLGGYIFARRRRREQETIPETRRRGGKSAPSTPKGTKKHTSNEKGGDA